MSKSFFVNGNSLNEIRYNGNGVQSVYYNDICVWDLRNSLVKFYSTSSFSIYPYISIADRLDTSGVWDGTMEYSVDNGSTWNVWSKAGEKVIARKSSGSKEYAILLRGTGNTYVTGGYKYGVVGITWEIEGDSVYCTGNLETLLDYQTVAAGGHPLPVWGAFACMFTDQTALTRATLMFPPTMPADCYYQMFKGCTYLSMGPAVLEDYIKTSGNGSSGSNACGEMFAGCSRLQKAPSLPSNEYWGWNQYWRMFEGCVRLTEVPLLGRMLPEDYYDWAYGNAFYGCTGLKKIQSLPQIDVDITTPTDTVMKNMYGATGILFSATPTDECNILAYTLKDNQPYYTNVEVFYPEI